MSKPALKVRGTCKCGHTVETTAERGRVTWRGPCPKCGQRVYASRIKAGDPPAASDTPPDNEQTKPEPRPGSRTRRKVVKASGYEISGGGPGPDDPGPAQRRPDVQRTPEHGPDGPAPDPGPEPARGGQPEPVKADGPEHGADQPRRRRFALRATGPEHPRRSVTPYDDLY